MRIILGLLIACSWSTADARPHVAAKHAAIAKKPKAKAHKKAKTEEVAAEKPAPAPEPRVERAPVKQVVDDEEPEVRKRK
jgi:hypothetical protein